MMFSGHVVNATLCGLMWSRYSHLAPVVIQGVGNNGSGFHKSSSNTLLHLETQKYARDEAEKSKKARKCATKCGSFSLEIDSVFLKNATVWIYVTLIYMAIISTRFHYSMDVFIGFALTLLMWRSYHYAAYIVQNTPREYRGCNLLSFVLYMESFSEFDSDHVSENIETASFRYDVDTVSESTKLLGSRGLFIRTRETDSNSSNESTLESPQAEREKLPESPRSYGSSHPYFPRVSSNPFLYKERNTTQTYESFRSLS
uniref:Sphingomyelin synthase-like domain-containing protein n=1 Tax=Aplanochytrium stocchinoi TaxID=215587 RepID=A0A7S3PRE5_9STRA|mmetsp:Transcript_3359/g.4236  ORF Transcript_3359/g.4236 Transcript_3359/m.4236 type:complete len:258 (-) Transcript_3359:236-1009(-)